MRGWANNGDQGTGLVARAICTGIVARVQRQDDSWFILASNELGVPESVLRDHATHGDSLSLAILIHVTRQQFSHYSKPWWPDYEFSKVLEAASRFNAHDTSAELQHEFCALWNRIILKAQNVDVVNVDDDLTMAWYILRPIRNVYIALHQDATPTRFSAPTSDREVSWWKPSSYPSCNIPGHHPDSTPHVRDVSTPTTFTRAVLRHNAALVPASLASTPNAPSSSVPASLRIDENPAYVPPLGNNISVPVSLPPAYQTTTESFHIPATSPDSATAGATRDIDTSARTMPPTTPETSTPLSSASSTGAVPPRHNADPLTSSDAPDFPSPALPNPVLDNILPTGPPLSSPSPMTRPDDSPSFPESHCLILATTAPSTSPGQTFVPDLGAAAENEGTPNTAMRK